MSNRKKIIKASLKDTSIVADILGEAFYSDPIICHSAGREGISRDLFELEFRNIYAPLNCSFCIFDENENIMGCALWAQPGIKLSVSLPTIAMIGWTILNRAGVHSLKRFIELAEFLDRNHLQEPHYYLHAIGVKNSFRGRGAGSGLLAHVLNMADNEQVPAYLENSNELNLPLYEKYGFTVMEKKNTPNGGPPIWFMRRSPKSPIPLND